MKKTGFLVIIGAVFMFVLIQGLPVKAFVTKETAVISKATAAVVKVEKAVKVQNFDPNAVQKLLNLAKIENGKVQKLGKSYAMTYNSLEKRLKSVANRIIQRRAEIARAVAAKAEAAAKKAAAEKAQAEAAKTLEEKLAAEKAAAEEAAKTAAEKSSMASAALEIHGFYSGNTVYDSNAEKYLKGLTSVSFAWMKLENTNGMPVLSTKDTTHDFHYPGNFDSPLKFCRENNIGAQIAIYADGNTVKPLIAQQESRTRLIDSIVNSLLTSLQSGGSFEFSGVVIDFESFKQQDTKEYFNQFLRELKPRLSEKNKKLYVAVNVLENYPGYDYKEILKLSDRVILMAHDYAPSQSITKGDVSKYLNYNSADPIRSLAPIKKVQYNLGELIGCINEKGDLKKIMLQISFGAAQWQFGLDSPQEWTSLFSGAVGTYSNPTYAMIKNRMENGDKIGTSFTFGYINELESPYLSYYNISKRTFNFILYEDERSVIAKMRMAKEVGIGGISIWRLGTMPDFEVATSEKGYLDVWKAIMKEK